MHKVLIVDDESWVLESLKDLVDWARYGFEVAGQANNGTDALEAMRRLRPDVVFTDIRMPEMSGLELIQRGRSVGFPVHFVVVSGYAEFAYAQKAMSYGAVAYCLKPFDEPEISGVLMKLGKLLDAAKGTADSPLVQLLEEPSEDARAKLQGELERIGIGDWATAGIVPVVSVGQGELPGLRGPSIRLKMGPSKTAYLLGAVKAEELASGWRRQFPPDLSGIGIGAGITDLSGVRSAIAGADMLAHQFFVTGKRGVYEHRPYKENELNRRMSEISDAIAAVDMPAIDAAFRHIAELFREDALSTRHAFRVYNMTISFLFKLGQTEETLYSYEQLVQSFGDVFDMLGELQALVVRHCRGGEAHPPETKNRTFNQILQYVTDHFREELSLQGLSEQFFMNPSYISQLFKKEVGETFVGYISQLRIAHACKLLDENDDYSIHEIAEKIGYNDYFYFARLFKKMTGKTPTQYRSERK
ncbi:response regulator transcription factor [Paenibacillus sp. JDR-2]|uniref:response regulator transcription factor n=1 Tax=Paenibacillus sp. (strain JDR-2) TaxID=324057 RepID=UPI000166B2C6|nr:response regulator transcription factor [Paenibacillus sp. JDR-2]ACS99422.1 two component transcriptional regulator, AraC family [Paenibacillus sp. JDR-2]